MDSLFKEIEIRLVTQQENTNIPYSGLRAFHQDNNWAMLAITFQGLKGAIELFTADGVFFDRHQVFVKSGHPGTGVRDAIEYVTRAISRNCYRVDQGFSFARVNPYANFSYAFEVSLNHRTLRCLLREGVLPEQFFSFFICFGTAVVSDVQQAEFNQLKASIELHVLSLSPTKIFEYQWL